MYKQSSLQPIINILNTGKVLSPSDIALHLGKSKVTVHKYIKELEIRLERIKELF